jgi:hypothetical protein
MANATPQVSAGKGLSFTVDGASQVSAAIDKVAEFDTVQAANLAAEKLLPYVRQNTRVFTGFLSSMWQARDGGFANPAEYAVSQEYGTLYIEPTHALIGAWEQYEGDVVSAYEEVINNAISDAGLDY